MKNNSENKGIVKQVDIEVKGGLRRAAVVVEATGIDLNPSEGGWKGTKQIELEPPLIDFRATLKAGRDADYKITITINNKQKIIEGTISKGIKAIHEDFEFSAFGL